MSQAQDPTPAGGEPTLATLDAGRRTSTPAPRPKQLLLRSKLQAPRVPARHVSRPHLLDLLDSGRAQRLTLVCAPPGYGKTALLAEWRARGVAGRAFAWLTLDQDDRDPVRLWAHLVWAIRETAPELDTLRPLDVDLYPDNLVHGALPLLLEALADLPGERVIVLDDYHLADDELWDASLEFFLEHLPQNVQLVIASRSAPRLPLARLRAHGDLLELGTEELRMSREEATRVADAIMGDPLPDGDLGTLIERCEGWPAGIHLASLLLQHSAGQPVEALAGDNRYVFDYLESDLLDGLSAEMRSFLRHTSILSRISAPLADAVTGTTGSRRLLEEAEHANLFLVPLDDRREWFRYHHLFADVLRRELEDGEPELAPVLHGRAAAWCEGHGDVEGAVAHAIQSRDGRLASDLVTRHANEVIRGGQIRTLERWLGELSWAGAVADPQLAVVRALTLGLLNASSEAVEDWLHVAERGTHEGPLANGMPSLRFGASIVRALFVLDDVTRAVDAGRWSFDHSEKGAEWRLEALLARGQTLYLSGRAATAQAVLEQALIEARVDMPQPTADVLAYLALIALDRGELARGESLARRSMEILDGAGRGDRVCGSVGHLALGVALGASGALAEAEAEVERGVQLRAAGGPTVPHAHALVLLARAQLARGDVAGARETLETAVLEVDGLRDPGIVSTLLEDTEHRLQAGARRPVSTGEELSERELGILRLLAAGLTKPEIARELYIAYNTVKTHTRTIYRKLGVQTRGEAVTRAREQGLY